MFTKAINPNFEDNGRRKRLVGFIGTLTDESNIVIHSMEYRTYSEAEIRLDLLVHELLLDAASRGLVDTVPTPDLPLFDDVARVIDMALGQSHGATSVVAELRRVRARLVQV